MKLTIDWKLNLKTKEIVEKVKKATQQAMRDTVVLIHNDAIKNARSVNFWKTGHNARSIVSEVSSLGTVQQGGDAEPQRIVDDNKVEGAVYSTSGYGGYGETGTRNMPARPYMKPAMDKNFTREKFAERVEGHLK